MNLLTSFGAKKKQEICPYYERGFCKVGNDQCGYDHPYDAEDGADVPGTKVCVNYLIGFCPLGPECKYVHIKTMIAPEDLKLTSIGNFCQEENWVDHKVQIQNQYNGPG